MIADAVSRGGEWDKIQEAQDLLAAGDALRALGEFKDAVAEYEDSISKAEGA